MGKYAVTIALGLCVFVVLANPGKANVFNFQDFCSWPYLETASNGVSAIGKMGTELMLAHTNTINSANGLWYPNLVNAGGGFVTTFKFRVANNVGGGGHGFAFVIQNQSPSAVGGVGADLGYSGLINSLAIEFDMHKDTVNQDPNDNHVSIHSRGQIGNSAVEQQPAGIGFGACTGGPPGAEWLSTSVSNMKDGQVHSVEISYTGANRQLKITVDSTVVLRCPINLQTALQLQLSSNSSYVGFTAATGQVSSDIVLTQWTLQDVMAHGAPQECFPGFLPSLSCMPPTALLGSNCGGGDDSCDKCLSFSRDCCGWCAGSLKCQASTTQGRPSHASTCTTTAELTCPAPPQLPSGDPGLVVGLVVAFIVVGLAGVGVFWYRRKKGLPCGPSLGGGGAGGAGERQPIAAATASSSPAREYSRM